MEGENGQRYLGIDRHCLRSYVSSLISKKTNNIRVSPRL